MGAPTRRSSHPIHAHPTWSSVWRVCQENSNICVAATSNRDEPPVASHVPGPYCPRLASFCGAVWRIGRLASRCITARVAIEEGAEGSGPNLFGPGHLPTVMIQRGARKG